MKDKRLATGKIREMLHYVARFRNSTFNIVIDGRVLEDSDILSVAEDISLIHAVGIRTVLVLGSSDQTDSSTRRKGKYARLQSLARQLAQHINTVHHRLPTIQEREGGETDLFAVQVNEESLGVELLQNKVNALLDEGRIPLVVARPKDEYNDESWFASLLRVAGNLCTAISTDKLVYLSGVDGIFQGGHNLLREATLEEIHLLVADGTINGQVAEFVKTAEAAIGVGVTRVHLISGKVEGSLVNEIFTNDGVGTMVHRNPYQEIRQARTSDILGILGIIGAQAGHGGTRCHMEKKIEAQLEHYRVVVKDDRVVACGCIRCFPSEGKALISSLAVDQPYLSQGVGELLLRNLSEVARKQGINLLALISPQTGQWWLSREFCVGKVSDLPADLSVSFSSPNAMILIRQL